MRIQTFTRDFSILFDKFYYAQFGYQKLYRFDQMSFESISCLSRYCHCALCTKRCTCACLSLCVLIFDWMHSIFALFGYIHLNVFVEMWNIYSFRLSICLRCAIEQKNENIFNSIQFARVRKKPTRLSIERVLEKKMSASLHVCENCESDGGKSGRQIHGIHRSMQLHRCVVDGFEWHVYVCA